MQFRKIIFCVLGCFFLQAHAEEREYPIVILGGGISALTAAVQASQAGYQPLVISGPMPGGIIVQTHSVTNWPGEIEISGPELANRMQKQAEARGVAFNQGEVIDIDVSKRPFTITIQDLFDKDKIQKIKAQTCIVALGAVPKLLHVPGEQENLYKNIFTCAPCDGLRFKDKTVAVIGGGDSSLEEALYLSNLAKKVYVLVRKDQFKTIDPHRRDTVLNLPNVEVLYHTSVTAFEKKEHGLSLRLKNQNRSENLAVDGAFLAIGSLPNSGIFKGKLELDSDGYIVLKNNQETSVPAIFAAGDVSDKEFKQATTAAGDAAKATLQTQKYLQGSKPLASTVAKQTEMLEIFSLDMLKKTLSSTDKPVVAYFYSENCSPCRSFRSIYTKWASQFQDKAVFVKINGNDALDCFNTYHVEVVPTILIFDDQGQMIHKSTGLKELMEVPQILTTPK